MKKFFSSLLLFVSILYAEQEPVATRWISESGGQKPLHQAVQPNVKIQMKLLTPRLKTSTRSFSGRICIVVDSNVYNNISAQVNQYAADLSTDGYSTVTYLYESGGAEGLRAQLSNLYFSAEALVGAVLIGDIPHIIYEMVQKFNTEPSSEYEDFPCDIFYMDLDGGWYDCSNSYPYSTGKYDTRDGNLDLEIWTARIKTDNLSALGSEIFLLTNYFNKNHNYRAGNLTVTNIALVYNDDPWAYMGEDDKSYVAQVYKDTVLVTNWDGTTADDYKSNRLTSDYQLIFIRSHGSGTSHGFYTNKTTFQSVSFSDYNSIDPKALFYSLFACSGEDYTINNYIGGTTVFNPEANGLVSWGSTKKGGMWKDYKFYRTAAPGASIGESFRTWFNYVQRNWSSYTPRWWYGMAIAGDAALPFKTPETLYVSLDARHIAPFDNWADAATNIETAIDAAGFGAMILVSNGIYNISKMLILSNDIILKSLSGAAETFINGGYPAQTNICVRLPGGSPSIEGFTISGGYGNFYPYNSGGGISVYYSCKGNISDCVVCGNRAIYGGGIRSYVPVVNCVISNNQSDSIGGGAYIQDDGYLENCLISDNYAGGWGGGVYLNECSGNNNCVISNNAAHDYGGGIHVGQRCGIENSIVCYNSAPEGGGVRTWVECDVRSCLVYGNTATNGAGVYCNGNGTIANCTIVNNYATNFAGGLYCFNNRVNTNLIVNNIVYFNSAANNPNYLNAGTQAHYYSHCCLYPELTGAADMGGNITNDPRFANTAAHNYHLQIPSPCINSGTNFSWMSEATDLDGNARILPNGGTVDLGCYEQIPEPFILSIIIFCLLSVKLRRES